MTNCYRFGQRYGDSCFLQSIPGRVLCQTARSRPATGVPLLVAEGRQAQVQKERELVNDQRARP
jgi:hypothetical protein